MVTLTGKRIPHGFRSSECIIEEVTTTDYPLEPSLTAGVCGCVDGLASVRVLDRPGVVLTVLQCLSCKDARVIRSRVPL